MSMSCFAHYAYGVIVSDEDAARIRAEIVAAVFGENTGDEDLVNDSFEGMGDDEIYNTINILDSKRSKLFNSLRKRYKVPDSAVLLYTGSDAVRMGECETDADVFIFGYGVMNFPRSIPKVFQKRKNVAWHSWVTCG